MAHGCRQTRWLQVFPVAHKLTFWRCRLEFSLNLYLHLGTECLSGKERLRLDETEGGNGTLILWCRDLRGCMAHISNVSSTHHKTSKSAECVIILATNQPSICEWKHTAVSQGNHASSRLWALRSFIFVYLTSMKSNVFSKQFRNAEIRLWPCLLLRAWAGQWILLFKNIIQSSSAKFWNTFHWRAELGCNIRYIL